MLLGEGRIAGHEHGGAEERVLVRLHQVAEGVAVTVLAAPDGLVVGHGCVASGTGRRCATWD